MTTRHKYGAVPTEVDGIRFASKAEARRYSELKLLERGGTITNLTLQPSYTFTSHDNTIIAYPSGRKVTYMADFSYFDQEASKYVVEDVKGMDTPVSKIKRAMMKACHHVDVVLIK